MTKTTSHALRQRGAASLIVVMVLFFVISMVAAYTNRNLIFEQKTAANQQRSTRALEAADAGIEWALTMLNTGRITNACATSALVTDTDFRQRYLVIDPANGNITPNTGDDGWLCQLVSTPRWRTETSTPPASIPEQAGAAAARSTPTRR